MKRVLVFTSVNDTKIEVRHYEANVGGTVNETDVEKKSIKLSPIGPCFDLSFRRDKIAETDHYKQACK